MPEEINQLKNWRIHSSWQRNCLWRTVPNCYEDAFILKGEIIEIKCKPTVPTGKIGMDAFGKNHILKIKE